MVAVNVVSCPRSYIDIEWWAKAVPEITREVASRATSGTILVFIVTPQSIEIFTADCGHCTCSYKTVFRRASFQKNLSCGRALPLRRYSVCYQSSIDP